MPTDGVYRGYPDQSTQIRTRPAGEGQYSMSLSISSITGLQIVLIGQSGGYSEYCHDNMRLLGTAGVLLVWVCCLTRPTGYSIRHEKPKIVARGSNGVPIDAKR